MKYVYVLTTTEDMQFEKSKLHSFVVKTLNDKLRQYDEEIYLKDLSFTTNGTLNLEDNVSKILEVDLDEIDNCDKYVLVLLGDLYGPVPHIDTFNRALEKKNISPRGEMSIAELETQYASLLNKDYHGKVFFYFRNLDLTDASEKEKIPYIDDDVNNIKKLNTLKDKLMEAYPDKVRTYPAYFDEKSKEVAGLEKFSYMVAKDFEETFERDIQLSFKTSFVEQIINDSKRYFKEHNKIYIPVTLKNLPQYEGAHFTEAPRLSVITGADGCGKTSLLSYLNKNINDSYKDGYEHVVPFVSKINSLTENGFNVFKEIIYIYEQNLSLPHKQFNKEETFDEEVLNYLFEVEQKATEEGISVLNCIIENVTPTIIEGLHYLDIYASKKRGLKNAYVGTHYYLTFKHSDEVISLCPFEQYSNRYEINKMSEKEAETFVEALMNQERRNIPHSVIQLLVKKESIRMPLYLETMIRYLLLPDLNVEDGNQPLELLTHNMYDLADVLSNDNERLIKNFIEDVANNINSAFVMRLLSLMYFTNCDITPKTVEDFFVTNNWEFSSLDLSLTIKFLKPLVETCGHDRKYGFVNNEIKAIVGNLLTSNNYEEVVPNILNFALNSNSNSELFLNSLYISSFSNNAATMLTTFRSLLIKLNEVKNKDEVRLAIASTINQLIKDGKQDLVVNFISQVSQMFPSKEFSFLYTHIPYEFKTEKESKSFLDYLLKLEHNFEDKVNLGNHFVDFGYLLVITRLLDYYAEDNFDEGFTLLNRNLKTIKSLRDIEVEYLNDYLGAVAHLLNKSGVQDLVAKHLGSNPLAAFYIDNKSLKDNDKKDYYQTIFKSRVLVDLVELRIQGEILNELTWSMLRDAIDTYKEVKNTYKGIWEYACPRDYECQVKASLLALHYLDYYRIDSFRGYDFKTPCEFMRTHLFPYSSVVATINLVDHLPLDIFRYNNENNDLDFGDQHDEFYAMFLRVVNRNKCLYELTKKNSDLESVINSMVEYLYFTSVNYEENVNPCDVAKEVLEVIFQYCKNTNFNIESFALSFNKIIHCFDVLKDNEENEPVMLYIEQLRNYFIGNHLVNALTSYLFNWYVRSDDMLYQTAILELEESRKAHELDERFEPYYDYFEQVIHELSD